MNTVIENMGYWSIIPPLLTVLIALIWKDVVIALITGIFSGALIVNKGNVANAAVQVVDRIASSLSDAWNIRIFLFCALLGSLVAILSRTGSAYAFGKWAAQRIKTRRGTLAFTFFFGLLIFIDDYFNSLSVGTAMRPVCDRMKISRAKLAYFLDSTAAPICIIAPVSSWVVTVMSYVRKGEGFSKLGMSEFDFFLRLIPYNLYVVFTLIFVVVLLIFQRDFGPMCRSERRALNDEGLFDAERYGKNVCDDSMMKDTGAKPLDMIFPLLVLIVTAVLSFPLTTYYSELKGGKVKTIAEAYKSMSLLDAFRNTDVSCALFYSIVVTLAVVILWCISRRLLKTNEISESIMDGVRSMIPALVILVLAWTIGGVIRSTPSEGGVGLASFLSQVVKNGSFPFALLPFLVFIFSCLIAFSTGTSWGCMAIMIPVTMPMAVAAAETLAPGAQLGAVLFVMSAAIGGAIYGDHASPISDTTILSATGAGCPCLEHVATQMPYASFVALCAGIGYLAGGWTLNLSVAFSVTTVLFILGVIFLPRIKALTK